MTSGNRFSDLASTQFEAIIASAMDAIVTVDEDFRIVSFNPAAERMFRIPAEDILGQGLDRFIPAPLRAVHHGHVERFARTGESYRKMGALGSINALRADGEEFPVEASISQAVVDGRRLSTVILRDISDKRAQEAMLLLAREVDHRAKNILAVVASLVTLTDAPTKEEYAQVLAGRVAALSRAHGLLSRERWSGASLGDLVREELDAHAGSARYSVGGVDLQLSERAVQPVSMLLHELATNAVKHGALSRPDGHVALFWSLKDDGWLSLSWHEHGGPPVIAPQRQGFGTTLIGQIVQHQLGGTMEVDWKPDGLHFTARLPPTIRKQNRAEPGPPHAAPPATAVEPELAQTDQAAAATGGTLLIVEDEPLLAMQLRQALGAFGWTVLGVAGSIEDANQMLAELPRPDAAILDVDLHGVPVFPLARALRKADVPFIFCTGFEDVAYAREFTGCKIVRKPATVLQIVAALRAVVRTAGETEIKLPER